mgnify:CR=1 FL=1
MWRGIVLSFFLFPMTERIPVHFSARITAVRAGEVELTDTETSEKHIFQYTNAAVRFQVGNVLDVRGHRSWGEVTIDSVE